MAIKPVRGRPTPLHQLTFELRSNHPPAASVEAVWSAALPGTKVSPPPKFLSGVPLVASAELLVALDARIHEMHGWLQPFLRAVSSDGKIQEALDVLAFDLAIVEAPSHPRGWDLRWVEFQAFSSVLATVYGLQQAHTILWPELLECEPWSAVPGGIGWVECTKQWLAPAEHSILLEDRPFEQSTSFDFAAASTLWGLPVTDTANVRVEGGAMSRRSELGGWAPVSHVSNRVILHKAEDPHKLKEMLDAAEVRWHSHPSGYYRINKGLMCDLLMRPEEQCARADRWQSLGLPPSELALKAIDSHGGVDVNLQVTQAALEALDHPEKWIVQPKYKPLPLFEASTGKPIFGEIRCMVLLREGSEPWLAGRMVRLSGGEKVSVSSQLGTEGEGVTVLHAPPKER
jgi:DNA-binding transcriptional LysR family regulator